MLSTPSSDALSLVRNSIDRAVLRAQTVIEGMPDVDSTVVLQDLRSLKLLADSLTREPQDVARLAGLHDAIEQLSSSR